MERRQLGNSEIEVSTLCLGTMTWGTQVSTEDAHLQLDAALDAGVNFVDTAEMYPVNPVREETVGRTERIIGIWLGDRLKRHDVVIATKHSGEGLQHVRGGAPISPKSIPVAIEGSLRRMKTDYVDLYQLHWPNRGSYMFRQNWDYDPSHNDAAQVRQDIADCAGALQREVDRGTILQFGLSNESAWGLSQWINASDKGSAPRPVSIQNEYSLLCRLFDTDLAELSHMENIGLLAYSPLGAGFLTGKYQSGKAPKGSRMSIIPEMGGRKTKRVFPAVKAYRDLASQNGLDPVQMSLAWAMQRPFMTSVIFGATTMDQLTLAVGASQVTLTPELLAEIDRIHKVHPLPY